LSNVPEDIIAIANKAVRRILPEKSKSQYEVEYHCLQTWIREKGVNSVNETVLLAYFGEKVGYLHHITNKCNNYYSCIQAKMFDVVEIFYD
jgi:hypothetical protein